MTELVLSNQSNSISDAILMVLTNDMKKISRSVLLEDIPNSAKNSIAGLSSIGSYVKGLYSIGRKEGFKASGSKATSNIYDLAIKVKKAPKIFKKDTHIDWALSAYEINNFIRGMSPYPTAQAVLNGVTYKIFKATIENTSHNSTIGEVLSDNKSFIKVACQDGVIHLLSLQMQGKKRMQVEDFLRGNNIN